jgi:hypothetical protein
MSPQRVDYYDSPEAPRANSLVPAVNVVMANVAGSQHPSSESSDVRWIPESELPGYTMDRSMRIRINDFLSRKAPVIN